MGLGQEGQKRESDRSQGLTSKSRAFEVKSGWQPMWQATAEEWHFEEAEEALRSTPKELGAEDTLLDELIDALNDGELQDQHKEALVAAIAGGADMLSWQIDRFTFNDDYAARLILCGDSDNLLVRASRRGRIESVRYLLSIGADVNGCKEWLRRLGAHGGRYPWEGGCGASADGCGR
jgi:hypothetical protein